MISKADAIEADRQAVAAAREAVVKNVGPTPEGYAPDVVDLRVAAATLLLLAQVGSAIDKRERAAAEFDRAMQDLT